MRSSRQARVAATAAFAALAITTVAFAASDVVGDRNDARGRLDMRRAATERESQGRVVEHRITTYRSWRSTYLREAGRRRYVCVYIWDDNGRPLPGRHDFQMCAQYSRGKLRGAVIDVKTRNTTAVNVRRGGRRRIAFDLPVAKLRLDDYHWLAATRDGGDRSFDIAPNTGPRRLRQPR